MRWLILFAALVAAKLSLFPDLFDQEAFKRYFQRREYINTFLIPSQAMSEILSFDRKLFMARFLDSLSITNRVYLLLSDQWEPVARASLALDPYNINPLEIVAYQYMYGKEEGDWSNFYKVDQLMHEHFDLAKRDWKLMMVMGYWWQFRLENLAGAQPYAKAIYDNPEAAMTARETYPILLSKLNEDEKAIALFKALLRHSDDPAERRWLEKTIKELENAQK
ncbi:MAG: hypothetical protein C6I00_02885 [Nitratiruptor sp.]|nr:hypothetical protein [Nitratiruptor sp.]NPA82895.1 hypothetical protein [Campylobacterota bacterium]